MGVGQQTQNSILSFNQGISETRAGNRHLQFKPYQVQKCVLIYKDFKFKNEFFVFLQILFLVFISNAQYCVFGIPYLVLTLIQLLNIALSHGRTDQNIRIVSMFITLTLLLYVPFDLMMHYIVHYIQES
jgi:hypothetical protein